MPAVYDLANRGLLPPGFSLVGFARREWKNEDFAQEVHDAVKEHARTEFREEVWQQLIQGMRFVQGTFDDDDAFERLRATIDELDKAQGTGGNFAFYLSVPPSAFPVVIQQLKHHLADQSKGSWRRAVIEKPFGHDLKSAEELNAIVHEVFASDQVFRIDHYLGKETVQNILALRFANTMFEPIWNRSFVDHVQITMAEDIGIGGRAGYYDGIGAARDVIQNHLLQLMALTAMEEPASFDADALAAEKTKVLGAVRIPRDLGRDTVRGQYAAGWQGGEKAVSYLQEDGIDPKSKTDTYAAIKVEVDNRRWGGGFFTCAPASAWAAVSPRSRWSSSAPRTPPSTTRRRRYGPERDRHPRPARRRHHGPLRLQGARHLHGDPGRLHGLRLRRVLHGVEPGGVRAPDPGRPAGDSNLFRARRRSSCPGRSSTDSQQQLQSTASPHSTPRTWGPVEADEMLERDGRSWRRP